MYIKNESILSVSSFFVFESTRLDVPDFISLILSPTYLRTPQHISHTACNSRQNRSHLHSKDQQ
jgi:hypothetical protein